MNFSHAAITVVSLAMLCLILANLIDRNEQRNIDLRVDWKPGADDEPEAGRFI